MVFFDYLASPHAVLSMIFGIFRKFPIGIGNRHFLIGYFFVNKKSKQKMIAKKKWSKSIFWMGDRPSYFCIKIFRRFCGDPFFNMTLFCDDLGAFLSKTV